MWFGITEKATLRDGGPLFYPCLGMRIKTSDVPADIVYSTPTGDPVTREKAGASVLQGLLSRKFQG